MQMNSQSSLAHTAVGSSLDLVMSRQPERSDLAACRDALSNGSRTFLAASFLLPRAVHGPACALYAFCRMADDAVDEGGQRDAVALLRRRLALAYEGRPQATPADRALAAVVATFRIPQALLDALLEGFDWDAGGRHYETLEDVLDYAARVAGSVGAMMALLMGVRSTQALARACELGVAMQLSNIARDVGEDARMGRLYLPRQWMREAGIDPDDWLAHPEFSGALAGVVGRLLAAADQLYLRIDAGVACLPWSCRAGINAARFLYADIGHEVARRGGDSVSQRAVVSPHRKVALMVRALGRLFPSDSALAEPPLPATRFLLDAVAGHDALPAERPGAVSARSLGHAVSQRALWLMDLYERLERRDQLRAQRGVAP